MNIDNSFTSDIIFPGMLYALTIRSPSARGILKEIISPEIPESCLLITAKDIKGKNELSDFPLPILADKNLDYIGQPIAILAGPDESLLEDISNRIFIDTDDMEPDFSMNNSAPDTENYMQIIKKEIVSENYPNEENKENLITGIYHTGIQDHWYSEPCGALVMLNDDGLIVYTASQWPYHVKRSVASVLGWKADRVNVKVSNPSLHMDGKIWYPSLLACHAAIAAELSGKPVKLVLNREEDFLFSPKKCMSEIKINTKLGSKNEIHNTEIDLKLNLGSRGIFTDELIDQSSLGAMGIYKHGSYKILGQAYITNLPVQGPMSGFGLSQGFFASERHASVIADLLGVDPAQWRKKNYNNEFFPAVGSVLKSRIPLDVLIDKAAGMCDYYRKWASYELLRKRRREEKLINRREPLRGIGITSAFQGNGFLHNTYTGCGNTAIEMILEKDGSLTVKSTLAFTETGSFEALSILAQDILGVEPKNINIINNANDAPDSGIYTFSRNITGFTQLFEKCCNSIRSLRFRDPLPITVKRSIKEKKVTGWTGEKISSDAFSNPAWGSAVVEAEIDPDTFIPGIRGIWLIADCGKIYSREKARQTLETGIIEALGWTRSEQIHYIEGQIPARYTQNYNIPSITDIPPIHIEFLESDSEVPRGIGELALNCIPAAYVQALSQAMDYHFNKIPLDSRDIWNAAQIIQEGSIA